MTRSEQERLGDIRAAIDRCIAYRAHLEDSRPDVSSMAYDAILRNLAVIGEAVKGLPHSVTSTSDIPWASIAGLRNVVVHEYFRVERPVIIEVVDQHLRALAAFIDDRER